MKSLLVLMLVLLNIAEPAENLMILERTSQDVYTFLASDKTNEIPYNVKTFNCSNFSGTLIRNAREQGFQVVAYVVLWKDDPIPHEFVAFNSSDKGIILIEPIDDSEYTIINNHLKNPNHYWDSKPIDWIKYIFNAHDYSHLRPIN